MDLSRIDMSISHGKLNSKKMLSAWWFIFIASLLLPVLTIVIAILTIILSETNEFIFYLLGADLFSFLLMSLALLFIVWNSKTKKKFTLYLEDGIEVKAEVKEEDRMLPYHSIFPYIKIRVDFQINDKFYTRFSSYGKGKTKGYHSVFKKYVGKVIKILYSPKYDEVLILKDK